MVEGDWASDTDEGGYPGILRGMAVLGLPVSQSLCYCSELDEPCEASVVSPENTNKDHTKEHRCTTYYTD